MSRIGMMLAIACLGIARSAGAFDSVDALMGFLDTNGIPFDRGRAGAAAVEAVLRSIDPGARRLTADEARTLGEPGGTNRATLASVEVWPEGLAYLKVDALEPGSGAELLAHLAALTDRAGVILDLRGAAGGDLAAAAAVASLFHCPGDPLLVLHDVRRRDPVSHTATATLPFRAPLMVLTDRETGGAAEALAACWRGVPGVMLIGTPTRGEAGVRELLPLPDGGGLYLTTRRVEPVDRPGYDQAGVVTDITVTSFEPAVSLVGEPPLRNRTPSAKTIRDRELMLRVNHDAVLRRATDILLGLKAIDHASS